MAFTNFSENTNYAYGVSQVTTVPLTLAAWIYPTSFATYNRMILTLANTAGADYNNRFVIYSSVTTGAVNAAAVNNSGTQGLATGGNLTLNAWNFVAGVFTSSTSRSVYLNTNAAVSNTTSSAPNAASRYGIGTNAKPLGSDTLNGNIIAEAGIWDVALTADEIAALQKGMPPQLIRPDNLQHYFPLIRELTDVIGPPPTLVGTLNPTNHPRIYGAAL